jgi:hypothetical protein
MRTSKIFAAALVAPVIAIASTLIPHTLMQRGQWAERVALVQVMESRVEPGNEKTPMKTITHVMVGEDFKGGGAQEFDIVQIGGVDGATSMHIPGDAEFSPGETAVVFVTCRLAKTRCHLVALGAGRLRFDGTYLRDRDLFTGEWTALTIDQLKAELKKGGAQ